MTPTPSQTKRDALEAFPMNRNKDGKIMDGSMACYEWVHKYEETIRKALKGEG